MKKALLVLMVLCLAMAGFSCKSAPPPPAEPEMGDLTGILGGRYSLELEDGFQYDNNYSKGVTTPFLLDGHQIVAGETYTLKVTYKASRDLENGVVINFVDTTQEANWWTLLSETGGEVDESGRDVEGSMPIAQIPASKAGEEVSATITLVTVRDATSDSGSANALVFRTFGEGEVGQPGGGVKKNVTLDFTQFVLTRN